jgi:hypothetical protein
MPFGSAKQFSLFYWRDILPFLEEMQEILEHVDKFPERVDIVVGAIDSEFTVISRELSYLVTSTDTDPVSVAGLLLLEYAELVHRAARHNVFFDIKTDDPLMLKDYPVRVDPVSPPSPPETLPPPDTHLSVPRPVPVPHPGPHLVPRPGPRPGAGAVPL